MRTQGSPILQSRPLGEGLRFCKSSVFNCSSWSLPGEPVRFKGELNLSVIKKLRVQCSLLANVIQIVFVNDYKVGLSSAIQKLNGVLCQNKSVICCSPEKIFLFLSTLEPFTGVFSLVLTISKVSRWKELGTDNMNRNQAKRNERTCPRSQTTSAVREG